MSSEPSNLELGSYRVLNHDNGSLWELGKGSYGTTYKAEHTHLERIAALKVINDHLVRDDQAKLRFKEEAKAASKLRHPHIANIDDFGEVDGVFYYVMEYCSGGDLEQFCAKRGPQQWPVVKDFALQILEALKAAHDKGMLHRDLKPSNIMLADDKEPVSLQLIDFGLVKALDQHNSSETAIMATREGAFMGNPLTASPEQFREEDLDERSDLFSVGITLWYLLQGGSPFGNIAAAKIAHQRLSVESYDDLFPPHIEPEARAILNKLLATDRENRFRYAQDAINAINSGITMEAPVATTTTEPAVEELPPIPQPILSNAPLEETWQISSTIKQLKYGTYYSCAHKHDGSIPPCTIFLPEPKSPFLSSIQKHGNQLVQATTFGLCTFYSEGQLEENKAFLCQSLSTATLQTLLQRVNRLSIHNDLALLKQVALAVDEAKKHHLPGVEMEDSEIFISLDPTLGRGELTTEEWPSYIDHEARVDGGHTAGMVAIVLPRLIDDSMPQEASATIGGDDLASNPLARFAGFLYRVLSGMSAKQTAYLSTVNYVSFSDVSEESNQFLSHIIAGLETPESAMSLLQQICQDEGCQFDGAAATIQASVSATNPLMATVSMTSPPNVEAKASTSGLVPPPNVAATASATASSPPPVSASTSGLVPPPVSASQSATAVTPPPVQKKAVVTPPPVKAKPKTKKKKSPMLFIIPLALLALGGLGAGGYYGYKHFTKKKGSTNDPAFAYDGPVEAGVGEITFSRLVPSKGLAQIPVGLQDAKGVTLGKTTISETAAIITDFPLDVFDSTDRWPLKFVSLDSKYLVKSDVFDQESFSTPSDKTLECIELVKLEAKATTIIKPKLTYGSNEVANTEGLMKFLVGKDGVQQWQISRDGNDTRVTLAPGQDFPIEADLAVPYMRPVSLTIDRDSSPSATLKMTTRQLNFVGLESVHELSYAPDFSKIKDEAVRDLLRGKTEPIKTTGADLQQRQNRWRVPSLLGSISVQHAGTPNIVLVDVNTKYLVFAGAFTHLPTETDEMVALRKLAEEGSVTDQTNLAVMYFKSQIADQNRPLADTLSFQWFRAAADQGDPVGLTEVGYAYLNGIGVDANPQLAFQWLSKGSEAGNARATGYLGLCYENGAGCKKNLAEAERLYLLASQNGDGQSMGNLAAIYLDSNSAEKKKEALEWLKKGAELENPYSLYGLGFAYFEGEGVPKDKEKAKELLKRAAALGDPNAPGLLRQLGN